MVTCPACGSASVTNAGRFSVNPAEAAQHFVLAEADPGRHTRLAIHIGMLWGKRQCEMQECGACGLGFSDPFVAGDAEFYNLAYPHSDYPKDKWEFNLTVDALANLPTQGKRAIEIGSGFGYFLHKISPRFFARDQLTAIEYNDVAGEKLAEAGFNWANRDIRSETFAGEDASFDYVFMFQVLEHMDDLAALANRLRKITKVGARIYIAVPNPERIRFNENNGSLLDMPPNHISLWTRKAFEAFGARMGCDVIDFQTESMAWPKLARQDIQYAYLRRAQVKGTIENAVRGLPRSALRRVFEGAVAVARAPARIPHWNAARRLGSELGGSIWAEFERGQ